MAPTLPIRAAAVAPLLGTTPDHETVRLESGAPSATAVQPASDRQLPGPKWTQIAQQLNRPELATANRAYRRANTRRRRGHKLAGIR